MKDEYSSVGSNISFKINKTNGREQTLPFRRISIYIDTSKLHEYNSYSLSAGGTWRLSKRKLWKWRSSESNLKVGETWQPLCGVNLLGSPSSMTRHWCSYDDTSTLGASSPSISLQFQAEKASWPRRVEGDQTPKLLNSCNSGILKQGTTLGENKGVRVEESNFIDKNLPVLASSDKCSRLIC